LIFIALIYNLLPVFQEIKTGSMFDFKPPFLFF